MSTDHNYAGSGLCDSVVENDEKSLESNKISASDHAYSIETEDHNSADCSAGSKKPSQHDTDLESGDVAKSKLEEETEDIVLAVNNNSVEEEDDRVLVDENSEQNIDEKENVLENKSDGSVDETDKTNNLTDKAENSESCMGKENENTIENSTEVNKTINTVNSESAENSESQKFEENENVTEISTEIDKANSESAENSESQKFEEDKNATENSTEVDKANDSVNSESAENSALQKVEENLNATKNSMDIDEDSNIVDNGSVKNSEPQKCEENMDITENNTEKDKDDIKGESSDKGETNLTVSDNEDSSTGELIMDIGDGDNRPEGGDASDDENSSEDEQIILLSPVPPEETEPDDETVHESTAEDSRDKEKTVETNNNCLTDKLSLEKPVNTDTKNMDVETKDSDIGDDKEKTGKTDGNDTASETTEDYSVNTDSRGKFDDDAVQSGDENTASSKDPTGSSENKDIETQASLSNSDGESVDAAEKEVKPSVGRKRKKPIAFEEFLTNDDEIKEEVKRTKKLDGDSETPRRGRGYAAATAAVDSEALLEPFKHGWMRELVYRSTGNTACDTYYFAPEGKKLRSLVQVADYLEATNSPLSVNNFSFSRKILHKPPFEVVRQAGRVGLPKGTPSPAKKVKSSPKLTPGTVAKRRRGRPPKNRDANTTEPKTHSATKFSNVEIIIERDTDEVSLPSLGVSPKVSSPQPVTTATVVTAVSAVSTASPPVTKETKTVMSTSKNVVLIKQEQNIDFNISTLLNTNTTSSPAEGEDLHKKKMVARKSTTPRPKMMKLFGNNKTPNNSEKEPTSEVSCNQLCTLDCPGLEGTPPTLQCASCICLFHPECVNYQGNGDFYCYICIQNGKKSSVGTSVAYKQSVVFGVGSQSTAKTSVAMDLQNVTSQAIQMIYQSQASATPVAPSLYTLKLAPNNGLVSDRLIPSLQHASSPSVINLPTLQFHESVNAKSALRTALDKRIQSPVSVVGSTMYKTTEINSTSLTSMAACTSISSTVPALPTLISAGMLSVNSTDISQSRSSLLKMIPAPPRLTLAPGIIPPVSTSSDIPSSQCSNVSTSKSSNSDVPLNAQLLTLPKAVTKRLKLSQPLALKINNIQVVVPPSCVIGSADGLKVLLPPNTFPLPTDPNQKLSVTVSNNTDPEVNKLTEPFLQSPSQTNVDKSGINKKLSPGSVRKERKKKSIGPASCFIKNLYGGYDCMLEIFKYLKTADLLRASCVCRTWQQIAKQPCLWRSVSLRGLTITDWDKATVFFKNVRLESLSLMGMCHGDDRNKTWHNLMSNLHNLAGVTSIEFGLVPAAVLHMVCEKLPGLEIFKAEFISDATGDQMWSTPCKTYMGKFAALKQLQELRLRGIGGLTLPTFSFSGGLTELGSLKNLISLSLTTLRSVSDNEFHFLREMKQLTELELGDCTNWSSEIYFILGELTNLKKLRLECGGEIPDIGLTDMLVNLKSLEVLELIMFQIADTFENALGQLDKLHTLVIWPDTTTEMAAAVNSNTLAAVSKLKNLQHLEWGVVSSETSRDSSGTEKQTEYIPILPQGGTQVENSDMSLLSERISIIKLTEKLCMLLPQVSIRVFNTKVVPHTTKNGSS